MHGKFLSSKRSLAIGAIVSPALSVAAILLCYYKVSNKPRILWALSNFPPTFALACVLLLVLAWLLDAMRLICLAKVLGKSLGFFDAFLAILTGNFITLVTPFLFGGAPAIVYLLKEAGLTWGEATAVVFGGGVLSQTALSVLALLSLSVVRVTLRPTPWEKSYFGFTAAYLTLLWAAVLASTNARALRNWIWGRDRSPAFRWLGSLLDEFGQSSAILVKKGGRWLLLGFLSALGYFACFYGISPIVLKGVNGAAPGAGLASISLQVLAQMLAGFVPTPGGAGASEFLAFHMLGAIAPRPKLVAYLVLWRVFTFYLNLAVGALAFSFSAHRVLARATPASAAQKEVPDRGN